MQNTIEQFTVDEDETKLSSLFTVTVLLHFFLLFDEAVEIVLVLIAIGAADLINCGDLEGKRHTKTKRNQDNNCFKS